MLTPTGSGKLVNIEEEVNRLHRILIDAELCSLKYPLVSVGRYHKLPVTPWAMLIRMTDEEIIDLFRKD
jgi:hypothetical protein